MSTYKCPECGNPINLNEHHCANCDYDVTDNEYAALVPASASAPVVEKPTAPQVSASQRPVAASGIDSIMAHGSVDASSHHSEDKSTHNIDNSQTVNNTNQTVTNTFIIMGAGPSPLPQNIDPQTAEALKQAQQAQTQQATQQQATPTFSTPTQSQMAAPAQEGAKGIGSIDGTITKNNKKSKKGWIAIVAAVIVVAVVAVVVIGGKDEPSIAQPTTSAVAPKSTKEAPVKVVETQPTATTQQSISQSVATAPTTNKKATVAKPKEPTLAEMTPAQAYKKGMQLFDKGDYSQAIAHLEKAANANHADAAYHLGEMYLNGVGVEANKQTAIRWYKVAAKAGHKQAKRKLF